VEIPTASSPAATTTRPFWEHDEIPAAPPTTMLRRIAADNEAGGRRKLKNR